MGTVDASQAAEVIHIDGWHCVCGKSFKTNKGLKIHLSKKKCARPDSSAEEVPVAEPLAHEDYVGNAPVVEEVLEESNDPNATRSIPAGVVTKARIRWPKMNDDVQWKMLNTDIEDSLARVLKGSLEKRLKCFSDVVYERAKERFGIEERVAPCATQTNRPNRRQVEKGKLRTEQRILKNRLRVASEDEKLGIEELLEHIRVKIKRICRTERVRKKRAESRRKRMAFLRNPYGFTKKLFEESKSGTLQAPQEEVEEHLKRTYSDNQRDAPLPHMGGLQHPTCPGADLDMGDLKWSEVECVIRKSRAKSAPGLNGVSYKVFKKCPSAARALWKLLREAWRESFVPVEWCLANGIYIPKEENSSELSQFRPISLLNVEGKIFFSVLSRRLSNYVLQNGYIDTSVQKAGIPGFPGCLEHANAIWSMIKRAKAEKLNLDVIWLDLANAYGSVPHKLIDSALTYFHVPQKLQTVLHKYYDSFMMRFNVLKYTTGWQPLEVGIPMGCSVSPLLFVMAMEMLLRGAEGSGQGVELSPNQVLPPMRAYMDDITILSEDSTNTRALLERLDELIGWARMKFKPKKSRSLSIVKGKVVETKFKISDENIPTVSENPVKSLGRWYSSMTSDRNRGMQIQQQVIHGLEAIEKSTLPGKFKVWCVQFGLFPRILWPLQVYDVALSRVERMQQKISACLRRWLGVPHFLSTNALYSSTSTLQLPLTSLVEEFKVGKARTYLLLRDSKDPVIKSLQPDVWSGRKWEAATAVEEAESQLRFSEIVGSVQKGRQGLGLVKNRWWSKESERGQKELVTARLRENEEGIRTARSVGQAQQGGWTRWSNVVERRVSWSALWQLEPLRVSFLIRSVYDVLPSKSNLVKWNLAASDACPLCQDRETLEHALAACKECLPMYTWRHNQVLRKVGDVIRTHCDEVSKSSQQERQRVEFVKAGEKKPSKASYPTGLKAGSNWQVRIDLDTALHFPSHIVQSTLRPDIVVWSDVAKQVMLIELTVPWEDNMEWAHERKAARYADLKAQCEDKGWACQVFPIEVGCRGFVGRSVLALMKRLGVKPRATQALVKALQETAESSSSWIWSARRSRSPGLPT